MVERDCILHRDEFFPLNIPHNMPMGKVTISLGLAKKLNGAKTGFSPLTSKPSQIF